MSYSHKITQTIGTVIVNPHVFKKADQKYISDITKKASLKTD